MMLGANLKERIKLEAFKFPSRQLRRPDGYTDRNLRNLSLIQKGSKAS